MTSQDRPTRTDFKILDKQATLLLLALETGSVRRGVIKNALEAADKFPTDSTFLRSHRVTFGGRHLWEATKHLSPTVATNTPVPEALRLVGGGAWSLAREAEKYIRLAGGRGSICATLALYAKHEPSQPLHFFRSSAQLADRLFDITRRGKVQLLSFDELWNSFDKLWNSYRMVTQTSFNTLIFCPRITNRFYRGLWPPVAK